MSNQTPLNNPSPKERFIQHASDVHHHREAMVSDSFERASDLAMLHHMARVTQNVGTDATADAAAANQIKGALDYLLTLRMLGEVPRITKPSDTDNLKNQ